MAHSPNNSETLRDFNRLPVNLRKSAIQEVLPEYFQEDYPNLIAFLEGYYEYLDSDAQWGGIINEISAIRDFEDTELERLDFLFDEVGLGIGSGQFKFPREVIRNFGNFFRVKGSEYSGYGFFRSFFNEEDVEILYPKNDLIYVGVDEIGTEFGKRIHDGKIYQVFSLLVSSPFPIHVWETLWRKYVHPSGYHLAAEVMILSNVPVGVTTEESLPELDPREKVHSSASLVFGRIEGEVTGIYADNNDGTGYVNAGYVNPGYYTPEEDDVDHAPERLSVYKTPEKFGLSETIRYIDTNFADVDHWAGFHLTYDDTFTKFSSTSPFTTFDGTYHIKASDSDGPVSLYNYYK